MIFHRTDVEGAFRIELERRADNRGFYARNFCVEEFAAHGLETSIVQINSSISYNKGTLRGFHYQLPPHAEAKTIRIMRGRLIMFIVDLRPHSPTFMKHTGIETDQEARTIIHVPKGCANAFLSLEDDTELIYFMSDRYHPEVERGIRWNDPTLGVPWPAEPEVMSDKDKALPLFDPAWHLPRQS